jgi:hypothetical protein
MYISSPVNFQFRMNMRWSGILGVLLCLGIVCLLLVVYLAGPAGPAKDRVSGVSAGIVQVTGPVQPELFSFNDANQRAVDYLIGSSNQSSDTEICYILGRGVDENGNAPSWMYGVRHPGGTSLLVYDKSGWSMIPWTGALPVERIDPDTIVPLAKLMYDNLDLLGTGAGLARQVELSDNTYTISVSDNNEMRIFLFNATTGVLIRQYEG